MKDFKDILNNDISDELLAAYIDGNTTESENALIENALNGDSMLAEACEIVSDNVSFGSDFDWDIHKGDFGFWEMGLPPVVGEENTDQQTNIGIQGNMSLPLSDDNILSIESHINDMNKGDITANDLNINDC